MTICGETDGGPAPRTTAAPPDAGLDISPIAGIRVLLVDDEKGFVEVLGKRLAKRRLQVSHAFSGTQAIRMLRRQDFDLAVLDLKLEDMDGLEILKIFKKMDPELAVIMLTGHGSEQAAREGIRLGVDDYLTKPCDFEELLAKIQDVVARKRRR